MNKDDLKRMLDAAALLDTLLRKGLATERGVHAETLIAAASRLSGTMLFRSFDFDVEDMDPGTTLLSSQANQEGPALVQALFTVLAQYGHDDLDPAKLTDATTAISHLTLAESQSKLEPWYRKVMQARELSYRDMALASSMATAALIHDCREVLDIHAAAAIAVYGIIEGAKTVPAAYAEATA